MAKWERPQKVKVIRDSGESIAIVDHPTKTPWTVTERQRNVEWHVAIYWKHDRAPLFFESRDRAKAWVKQHRRAGHYNWDALEVPDPSAIAIEVGDALTQYYCELAKRHGLPSDSPKVFRLAVKDGAFKREFKSLVFYPQYGCTVPPGGTPYAVPYAKWVKLPWLPLSCLHAGSSDMYDSSFNKLLSLREPSKRLDSLPCAVDSAYSV